MKKKRWTLIFGIMIICTGLSFAAPFGVIAEQKGSVTLAIRFSAFGMKGVDPLTNGGSVGMPVVASMYDGLIHYGSDGKHHPNIAKSWVIEPDWKYITFKLDENAKWADGKPVTAADVKHSFKHAMRKENKRFVWNSELNRSIDRVEIVDDYTVRVYLKGAYPAILDRSSKEFVITPKHVVEKLGYDEFSRQGLGSGSFKLEKFQQDVYAQMTARKAHHRRAPTIEALKIMYVPEHQTRLAMLQTGETDMAMIAAQHIKMVEEDPNFRITWSRNIYIQTLLFFALTKPEEPNPLLDIRVRQAIRFAIDYNSIAKNVFHDSVTPTWNIVAPYHPGHDPSKRSFPYDPEKAKKLLAEAGYPNGFSTIINSSSSYKTGAEALQASLSKVGINAKFEMLEHGTWRKYLQAKKLKCMGLHTTPYWNGRKHPYTALASTFESGNKYTYHDDKELDKEWTKLATMITGEEQAKQVRLLTKLYHEKMYRINLWAIHRPVALNKRIKYYKNAPGRSLPVNMEYITLN
jgi:peptide/nickel transport system substrate-binding protein